MGSAAPARPGWRLGLCLATAVVLSGCIQTTGDLVPPTTSATPAASTPILLNTGPAGQPPGTAAPANAAAPTATAATPAAPAPAAPAKADAAAPAPAVVASPPKKPVPTTAATAPAPVATPASASGAGTEPFPTSAPATPAPVAATTAASAPAKTADGFPNINIPPAQPAGTLLPPEERKRIISELEALRAKQGGPAPAAPPGTVKALATEAETHGAAAIKKIEACSEEGAADNPDCQAPSE